MDDDGPVWDNDLAGSDGGELVISMTVDGVACSII